jgi:uncharacterized protein (DUF302 family)
MEMLVKIIAGGLVIESPDKKIFKYKQKLSAKLKDMGLKVMGNIDIQGELKDTVILT